MLGLVEFYLIKWFQNLSSTCQVCLNILCHTVPSLEAMSIMSDRLTPSNGGKWELMHYVQWVSSHLPPLDGVDPSDMIDIGNMKNYHSHK